MLSGARVKSYEIWKRSNSKRMKVGNRELSYHTFLLVVLALAGGYTLLALNGSLSFHSFQLSDRGYPAVVECSGESLVRGNQTANKTTTPSPTPSPTTTTAAATTTELENIAFGLAAGSELWEKRKGYIKAWWKPERMRGAVWLDKMVSAAKDENLPLLAVSEDTSRFNYTYVGRAPPKRQKPQLRICRIVLETFRLKLPNIHWFVIGDDDTVFIADNLVRVLSKYDHTKFYYIGGISETHRQNTVDSCCTNHMAYGGAGYAISYALAEALDDILDECMERYTDLYGGSSRIHACLLELGVPLMREPGFHQLDINGDASGILGAHPIAPLVTLHHLDRIDPLFPGMSRGGSVEHFVQAANVDSGGALQQSVCYSKERKLTVQVSWGWAVQVTRVLLAPRVLQNPVRTFAGWGVPSLDESFEFRTRPVPDDLCERPVMFYMQSVGRQEHGSSLSMYARGPEAGCNMSDTLADLRWIVVRKEPADDSWFQAPRRQCCRITELFNHTLTLHVSDCRRGELTAIL